jgi:hypothetical protein
VGSAVRSVVRRGSGARGEAGRSGGDDEGFAEAGDVEIEEGGVAGCEVHVVEGTWGYIISKTPRVGNKSSTYLREVLG